MACGRGRLGGVLTLVPRLPRFERVLHEERVWELVPYARASRRDVRGDTGAFDPRGLREADNPRVVAVLVELPDLVRVGVLEIQLDMMLVPVEAVRAGCELGVFRRAVLTVELAGVPAARGRPALLLGVLTWWPDCKRAEQEAGGGQEGYLEDPAGFVNVVEALLESRSLVPVQQG